MNIPNYLSIGYRNPWIVLIFLLISTAWSFTSLQNLQMQISADDIMLKDNEERSFYNLFNDIFGEDEGVTLYLQDPELLAPGRVEQVREVLKEIRSLPYVTDILSLFSLKHVWIDENDEVHSSSYLDQDSLLNEQRQSLLELMLANPLVSENLLSDDGRSMAVWIQIDGQKAGTNPDRRVTQDIDQLLTPLETSLEQAFLIGSPVIRTAIIEKILKDQQLVLPGALVLLLLLLIIIQRKANGAVIPLLTGSLSVIWTLAFMAQAGIPINVMTSIVPALLIVVGSTEDIHLLTEYYSARKQGMSKDAALQKMAERMRLAVFLTYLTTGLGFLSVAANPIPMLQMFGVTAAVGLTFNFIITSLLVPAWIKILGSNRAETSAHYHFQKLQQIALLLLVPARKSKRLLISLLTVSFVISTYYALQLRVNNDPMDYFTSEDQVVEDLSILEKNLTGGHNFSIVLDGHIEDTFSQVRYLNDIKNLQLYLESTGLFRKTMSFADIIALVNRKGFLGDVFNTAISIITS